MISVHRRREALRDWMSSSSERNGLTASEIVERSGIYTGHARYDRCFDDLKALDFHRDGRPARWWAPVSYIVEDGSA